MSISPCSITAEEGYQTCASAPNQPEIYITHIYTTNSDASDWSPVELSATAKSLMLQQEMQQQQQQQQAKQKGGFTAIIRRSCRQRKRPRYFPPIELRIPAARRRQKKASYPLVCASLFLFAFLFSPPYPQDLEMQSNKIVYKEEDLNQKKTG